KMCSATRRDGQQCTTRALASGFCFSHDPAGAKRRKEASARGGRNKATVIRIAKGLPPELRDVQERLLGLLDRVEVGEVAARTASAIAAVAGRVLDLSRFAVETAERKELEERIDLLEEHLKLAGRR